MAAHTLVSPSLLTVSSPNFAARSRTQYLDGCYGGPAVRAQWNGASPSACKAFVVGLGCSRARGIGIGVGSGHCKLSLRNGEQDRRYFTGFLKGSATEALKQRVNDPQLASNEGKAVAVKPKNYVSAQLAGPGVRSLVVAMAIPLVLGNIDAFFNSPSSKWVHGLKKPWWEPPGPIFGVAWSILYPLMGLASWLVWADGGFHKNSIALVLYVSQLVLNLMWPLIFFGWKNLGLALVDIVALVVVLAATIKAFQPVNYVAANLMKPYLAWVVFATFLNLNLWWTNRGRSPEKQAA